MTDLVKSKFLPLEIDASAEKGGFELFALVLREDSPDKWDLVVAAPWISADKHEALVYLSRQINERLDPSELSALSRIVVLDNGNSILEDLLIFPEHEHKVQELHRCKFNDLVVDHAFIITSKRRSGPKRRRKRSLVPKN